MSETSNNSDLLGETAPVDETEQIPPPSAPDSGGYHSGIQPAAGRLLSLTGDRSLDRPKTFSDVQKEPAVDIDEGTGEKIKVPTKPASVG